MGQEQPAGRPSHSIPTAPAARLAQLAIPLPLVSHGCGWHRARLLLLLHPLLLLLLLRPLLRMRLRAFLRRLPPCLVLYLVLPLLILYCLLSTGTALGK